MSPRSTLRLQGHDGSEGGDGDRGSDGMQLKQLTVMQGESC